jgi:hypothetical protein
VKAMKVEVAIDSSDAASHTLRGAREGPAGFFNDAFDFDSAFIIGSTARM